MMMHGQNHIKVKSFLILIGLEPITISSMHNLKPISIQTPPLSFAFKFVSWYMCALTYNRELYLMLWQL